jgi:UDP-N-acetylmuramoyl-L-alanyl-D-glutamate--2,6-diaminopimelate ligase
MVLADVLSGLFDSGALSRAEVRVEGPVDRPVVGLSHDSREVGQDWVFVALPGQTFDGHAFVPRLVGLAAAVVERDVPVAPGVTRVLVPGTRPALAHLAAAFAGHPGRKLLLAAVTGTNGKTTITYLVEGALRKAGILAGVVGTTGFRLGGAPFDPGLAQSHVHTTPEASSLQTLLALMLAKGAGAAVMEASSIGLAAFRVDALPFRVAAFTNLTRDHLDVHGSMEAYRDAKVRLFRELLVPDGLAVLNRDDPAWTAMRSTGRRVWTYGLSEGDLHAEKMRLGPASSDLSAVTPAGTIALEVPLPGRHNVSNALAALGMAMGLGMDLSTAAEGIASAEVVPGRLEPVPNPCGLTVLVDYAHTPDALSNVLSALREVTGGRLLLVFGCGGDRDRGKRPEMGRIAGALADVVWVTSDNPRSEKPERIVCEILDGMRDVPDRVRVEVDRAAAIGRAIGEAREGDILLIAGKGHETTQEIAGEELPFDDRDVARNFLFHRCGKEP